VRYPTLKSGGFNVAKIVGTVTERISAKKAAEKREREKKNAAQNATALAAMVAEELGFKADAYACPIVGTESHSTPRGGRGSGYRYWTTEAPLGRVFYKVGTLTVTPEQARVLHDALLKIKSMEPKKEKA